MRPRLLLGVRPAEGRPPSGRPRYLRSGAPDPPKQEAPPKARAAPKQAAPQRKTISTVQSGASGLIPLAAQPRGRLWGATVGCYRPPRWGCAARLVT